MFDVKLAYECLAPGYLGISCDRKHMAIVHKKEDKIGECTWAKINDDDSLTKLSSIETVNRWACHVYIDDTTNRILTANYISGDNAIFSIDEDKLNIIKIFDNKIIGEKLIRGGSHSHFIALKYNKIWVCDLGLNAVIIYDNDTYKELGRIEMPDGMGPRHLTFNPDKPIIYIIGECDSSLVSADCKTYEVLQHIPTLGEIKTDSAASHIELSPDNNTIVGSNRFDDELFVTKIKPDFMLENVMRIPVDYKVPRDFTFVNEDLLLVGYQDSDIMVSYKKNGDTFIQAYEIDVPQPICIKIK